MNCPYCDALPGQTHRGKVGSVCKMLTAQYEQEMIERALLDKIPNLRWTAWDPSVYGELLEVVNELSALQRDPG